MKKGIMKITHFEENHRKRNKNTELLRTTFLFCLLALILQGPPSAEHKLWQIKRRNNYPSPSLFKAFLRGAVPKTNISCKFFTHRKLYYRALRSLLITLKSKFNIQTEKRKHKLCVRLSVDKLLSQALWADHKNETPICLKQEMFVVIFVCFLLFLMALLFVGKEINCYSEEVCFNF